MKNDISQNSIANFVQKTYNILNNPQYIKIIHWSSNGKQFTIKDIQLFEETILPKYFRHRNINSFIRQLNMYNFHKSRKQPTKNIFSHPCFMKDREDLLQSVKRKIKYQQIYQPKHYAQVKLLQHQIQQNMHPVKFQSIPSISSIPFQSTLYLQKQFTPLKSLISKSHIFDSDVYLNMRENHYQDTQKDNDDNISIADEIQRERKAFASRTQGISMVKTCNFLEDFYP